MKSEPFYTKLPGKWVLTGEHAVLQGMPAIALPQNQVFLSLRFDPSCEGIFEVLPSEAQPLIIELLDSIRDTWDFQRFPGRLTMESSIPVGAGLGSSAALCVALTRWIMHCTPSMASEQWQLAQTLEHRFHGRSSGMDTAVISSGEPLCFSMLGPKIEPIGIKKIPRFTFHDTSLRARTSDCVLKVQAFRDRSSALGRQWDATMGEASHLALEGLVLYDAGSESEGLKLIQKGMQRARACFYAWQLVPGDAKRLEENLLQQGALATKLTGAGGGGIVVALWGPMSLV